MRISQRWLLQNTGQQRPLHQKHHDYQKYQRLPHETDHLADCLLSKHQRNAQSYHSISPRRSHGLLERWYPPPHSACSWSRESFLQIRNAEGRKGFQQRLRNHISAIRQQFLPFGHAHWVLYKYDCLTQRSGVLWQEYSWGGSKTANIRR